MKYYLSMDCGGTKVAAILYDETLKRRGACVTGSVRANTTDPALIRKHTRELIEKLGLTGLTAAEYGGVCDGALVDAISGVCVLKRRGLSGELDAGLSAAGVFGDGLLALCGTGATLFARVGEKKLVAGGYGAAVADEGSGYYVGREALLAAIRDSEGRGEHTALTQMLPVSLGFAGAAELRQAIFSIYGHPDRSPAACVAACAPAAVDAAAQGDAVAERILTDAGRLLGEQLRFLIERHGLSDDLPLAVSGSMWRGNPILFNAFRETVLRQCEKRRIVVPRLEPVLGMPALRLYETEKEFTEESVKRLLSEFPEFEYDIGVRKGSGQKEAQPCCSTDTERR